MGAKLQRKPPARRIRKRKLRAVKLEWPPHLRGEVGWLCPETGHIFARPKETPPTRETEFAWARHAALCPGYRILEAAQRRALGVDNIEYETED